MVYILAAMDQILGLLMVAYVVAMVVAAVAPKETETTKEPEWPMDKNGYSVRSK